MGLPVTIIIPDFFPYLAAVLGLLLIWQYHDRQAKAGRIVATDFSDREGSRFFILMTPLESHLHTLRRDPRSRVASPSGETKTDQLHRGLCESVWDVAVCSSVSMAPGQKPDSCWSAWTWRDGWTDCA